MPPPFSKTHSAFSTAVTALTLATEVVVVGPVEAPTPDPASVISLLGVVIVSGAAGSTSTRLRVRRGGLAGVVVLDTNTIATAGANIFSLAIGGNEIPGDVAGTAYVVTATMAGAAGTATLASLLAIVN